MLGGTKILHRHTHTHTDTHTHTQTDTHIHTKRYIDTHTKTILYLVFLRKWRNKTKNQNTIIGNFSSGDVEKLTYLRVTVANQTTFARKLNLQY